MTVALRCLWLVLLMATVVRADALDDRFLDGLRQRRLFTLAESWCERRLRDASLSPASRAQVAIEWSRTLSEHALHSIEAEQQDRSQQARAVVEQALKSSVEPSQRVLLELQRVLVDLAQAALALQEAELTRDAQRLDQGRSLLRGALQRLDGVTKQIDELLRQQNLTPDKSPDALSVAQLGALQKNVALRRGRAYCQQGRSYAAGSADRIAALTQALQTLEPLSGLDPGDPVLFAARLEVITAHRLLGEVGVAERKLQSLLQLNPAPVVALAVRAEQLRVMLLRQQLPAALELIRSTPPTTATSAEWDLAVLEADLAAWNDAASAKRTEEVTQWQNLSTQQLATIDARHGPYWSRRAEMLLAALVSNTPLSSSLAALGLSAEAFYRQKEYDLALAKYDELSAAAQREGQLQRAFDAAYTAAAIEQSRERLAEAAVRFRRAALLAPALDRAASAHLAAIWALARAQREPTDEHVQQYLAWLEEHLQQWPNTATADQAWLWRGEYYQRRAQWRDAINSYRQIAADRPLYLSAITALAEQWPLGLQSERAAGKPTAELATEAAVFFEQVVMRGQPRWPERWGDVERLAAVTAARVWLTYFNQRFDRSEQILTAALSGSPDASEAWRRGALLLVIEAQVGARRLDQARQTLAQLSNGTPATLLPLLETLAKHSELAGDGLRQGLAQLVLETAARIGTDGQLSEAQQRRLALDVSRAKLTLGQIVEATGQLQTLAQRWPNDGDIQESYAVALSLATDPAVMQSALQQWREVERRSQPASERWFRAKYELASLHHRLGSNDRAIQIIEITRELHNDLGGPAMAARFNALRKQCGP